MIGLYHQLHIVEGTYLLLSGTLFVVDNGAKTQLSVKHNKTTVPQLDSEANQHIYT